MRKNMYMYCMVDAYQNIMPPAAEMRVLRRRGCFLYCLRECQLSAVSFPLISRYTVMRMVR